MASVAVRNQPPIKHDFDRSPPNPAGNSYVAVPIISLERPASVLDSNQVSAEKISAIYATLQEARMASAVIPANQNPPAAPVSKPRPASVLDGSRVSPERLRDIRLTLREVHDAAIKKEAVPGRTYKVTTDPESGQIAYVIDDQTTEQDFRDITGKFRETIYAEYKAAGYSVGVTDLQRRTDSSYDQNGRG